VKKITHTDSEKLLGEKSKPNETSVV